MFHQTITPRLSTNRLATARSLSTTLPLLLALMLAITPLTVSCQRSVDPQRGVQELRDVVENAAGKPPATELAKIESRFPKTRAAALARFLRGYLAFTAQDYATAVDAFDAKAIGATTALGDYAAFYRAESEAALGSRREALRDFNNVFSKYPDALKARDARLRAAEMRLGLNDADGAINELASLVDTQDADAIFITAQAYEALGQSDKAMNLYRRIYYETPATTASVKAEERLTVLGASVKEHPASFDEERQRADRLFEAQQFWAAAQAYDNLVKLYPEAERLDDINFRRGVSLVNAKQPAQAVLPLSRVGSRNTDMQAEAWFYQAQALRSSNRASEAAVLIDRLLSQFPKHRRTAEALNDFTNYLDKASRQGEAAARKRQLIALFPKSEFAAEASYELGAYAYQLKNYAEAARTLEQHLANYRYPESKFLGEAGFIAAKCEEKLGNRARALALYAAVIERYPYGYHGLMASRRAAALRNADRGLQAEAAKPGSELERMRRNLTFVEVVKETSDDADAVRVAKADEFTLLFIDDLAIKELNQALVKAPTSPRLNLRLAQVYAQKGEYFQASLILRRGYPDIYSYKDSDVPRQAWEIFFPLYHWDTIKQEARRYGIDPYFAAALIRQESVFNSTAVSRVGARGLMQLMPATGQLIAKQQGSGSITANDLFNPQLNIKLGMQYLAQMIGQLGRPEYAAAGYNAGPGRAKAWVAARGALDMEDWIETIPFAETRGYVQGVLRFAANYRRFYKE
ncbi:MAG: transglycosylase SLT domain-containing protein [Acidobacteria bacterium]|nr:transglycosylase SLT domain-containing protein [Acidobacteriota bacterium]